jgi:hypothetical protein
MRTVRRFYFYAVALISLEVIIWGVISLARTLVNEFPLGGTADLLASGLSLVLVGIPIFLLHWLIVQHDAAREEEEHSSLIRALFLFGVRLSNSIPIIFSLAAIANRTILSLMGEELSRGDFFGGGQTTPDNLIAVAVNLIAWFYFDRMLNQDWTDPDLPKENLTDIRRVYRYAWLLISLGTVVGGAWEIFRFLLDTSGSIQNSWLAGGISLLIIAAPVWAYTSLLIKGTLPIPTERNAVLRLVILFVVTVFSAITALIYLENLINSILQWLLGEFQTFSAFISNNGNILSFLIPVGVVWAYYRLQLYEQFSLLPDALRRASLERFYRSIFSLFGLVTTFFGMWQLLGTIVDFLWPQLIGASGIRARLAQSLAELLIGLPVWLLSWPRLQSEAGRGDTEGDHARRSIVRKGYLYLVMFVLVIGAMISAGMAAYLVFMQLLGKTQPEFWREFMQRLQTFALVMVWLIYHWYVLRQEGRRTQKVLSDRHAAFAALILHHDEQGLADEIASAIQRQTPRLPFALRDLSHEGIESDLLSAKVVILPADLAVNPPEVLRLWLRDFKGQRLVVPLPGKNWVWMGAFDRAPRALARDIARIVSQMAEGQTVRLNPPLSTWSMIAYVLGGLFLLQLLLVIIALFLSGLGN